MPRRKLSEFRAKTIVSNKLGLAYAGTSIDTSNPIAPQLRALPKTKTFAVKVDQAVKGRFKKGLVMLDVLPGRVAAAVKKLAAKGYTHLLVEPMVAHIAKNERYLSLTQSRDGLQLTYGNQGGVDVEANPQSLQHVTITPKTQWKQLAQATGWSAEHLRALVATFTQNHFTFLEINPYLATKSGPQLLDLAVEADDAGAYFVNDWSSADVRSPKTSAITQQEKTVGTLAEKSPASFMLEVIEPNGAVFLLLSGGGASITVADEVYASGLGHRLANYGEYSGNPNSEETYIYTRAVLELLLASSAKQKVLFIGGAVANFTDIATTFSGVIKAIGELAGQLRAQQVTVFVRRGGPREEIGLAALEQALKKFGLFGAVHNARTPLADAVAQSLQGIKP